VVFGLVWFAVRDLVLILAGHYMGGLIFYLFSIYGAMTLKSVFGTQFRIWQVQPAETFRWSWAHLRDGSGAGLIGGIGMIFYGALRLRHPEKIFDLLQLFVMGYALIVGPVAGLIPGEILTRAHPREGVRRSARSAAVVGSAVGLIAVAIFSLAGENLGGTIGVKIIGLGGGIVTGLVFGLQYGGFFVVRHLVIRLILWRKRLAPLRYVQFLDYVADRLFLCKVGGGYVFTHRMLMEFFASLYEEKGSE
jgi:hypothetical protein